MPLPPPGMPGVPPPGMPPPPPGMPPLGLGQASSSRMPPEVLAQKSQKWIQMQKKRYGEKRKGGFVDMGKQVCVACLAVSSPFAHVGVGPSTGARPKNHQGPR
jgi:hypothetical protein